MTHVKLRLAAFIVSFGPAVLLMSALPEAPVQPPALQAVLVGACVGGAPTEAARSCRGTPLGKGWCAKLACATGDCSANWKSVTSASCASRCVSPSWNCCGWRINTNEDCKCVDADAEPDGDNCGPCKKDYLAAW